MSIFTRSIAIVALLVACSNNAPPANDARVDSTVIPGVDSRIDAPSCIRSGVENTLALCSDGCDNGANDAGFFDCRNRDCCGVRTNCPLGTYCGNLAADGGLNICPGDGGRENTLAACTNGCSDDGDSYADCEERDCCNVLCGCGPRTYCGQQEGGSPVCIPDASVDARADTSTTTNDVAVDAVTDTATNG